MHQGECLMPKLNLDHWQEHPGAVNRVSGKNDGPYADVVLGDQVGLSQFGARLERLPPGSRSSHRHWHDAEDEFLYVLQGELVLVEDDETLLRPGDAAAWAAGKPIAHCLENRSSSPATYLIVGARTRQGSTYYPDDDVILHYDDDAKTRRFTRLDGTPIVTSTRDGRS